MANPSVKSKVRREVLLAGLMIFVLAASIGAACLVVYSRGESTRKAVSILEDIQSGGLSQYWKKQPDLRFYNLSIPAPKPQQLKSWEMRLREPHIDGGFHGASIIFFHDSIVWRYWKLDEKATQGHYEAGAIGPFKLAHIPKTTLDFSAGKVKTVYHADKPGKTATDLAEKSETFLPPGLLPLVLARLAQQSGEALFEIQYDAAFLRIANLNPKDYGQGRFLPISYTLERPHPNQPQNTFRLKVSVVYPDIGDHATRLTTTYHIDSNGNELARESTQLSSDAKVMPLMGLQRTVTDKQGAITEFWAGRINLLLTKLGLDSRLDPQLPVVP
ncbi:MAG TPA: hypothetical protein ENL03_02475 [Phycisphaerae bacterium]|nr:hypothetical protein [Phycisphaerae bacterium]